MFYLFLQVSQVELGKATRSVHTVSPSAAPHTVRSNSGKSVDLNNSADYDRDRTLLNNVVKSLQEASIATTGTSRVERNCDKKGTKSSKLPIRGRSSAVAPSGPIISHTLMNKERLKRNDTCSETSSDSSASRTPNKVRSLMYIHIYLFCFVLI